MKKLVAVLLLAVSAFAGEVVKRGAPISSDTPAVAIKSVLEKPEAYTKSPVVIEGVVLAACETRGCWMQVAPAAGEAGMRVTFKDYAFFVPLDSKGRAARMEGTVAVKTLSKADVDHLVGEGAKLKRNPDGTANEVSFVASGVELAPASQP